MKRTLSSLAITLGCLCTTGASAATLIKEIRVGPSLGDFDVACSTPGILVSCEDSFTRGFTRAFDPFDTTLGTLNSITVSYGAGVNGEWIMRGDDVALPSGDFETEIVAKLNGGEIGSETTDGTVVDTFTTDSTTKNYSTGLYGSQTYTSGSAFDRALAGAQISFRFEYYMFASVLDNVTCTSPFNSNPCGATNLITSVSTFRDLGPVTLPVNYWYATITYDYTPFPPPSEVPLPASGFGILAGLGALAMIRRRRC